MNAAGQIKVLRSVLFLEGSCGTGLYFAFTPCNTWLYVHTAYYNSGLCLQPDAHIIWANDLPLSAHLPLVLLHGVLRASPMTWSQL